MTTVTATVDVDRSADEVFVYPTNPMRHTGPADAPHRPATLGRRP